MRLIPLFLLALLQTHKPVVREVKATGCVLRSVQTGCLLLRTLDGNTIYNIYAEPKPLVRTVITIEARPHQGPNECKQGIPVDVIKWESTGEQCVP
jgi:hypothetical protein